MFNIQGVGLLAFEAIQARDFPVVMGFLVISSVLLMVGNLRVGPGGRVRRSARALRVAVMAWITLDPLTRRRLDRFRRIKRGYYSFLILLGGDRAVDLCALPRREPGAVRLVQRPGVLPHVPVSSRWTTFGQEPPPAWGTGELETEYLRLQREWQLERSSYERERAAAGTNATAVAALETKYPNRGNYVDHAADPVESVPERLLVQRDPQRDPGRARRRRHERARNASPGATGSTSSAELI